jgi:hypothetical protein
MALSEEWARSDGFVGLSDLWTAESGGVLAFFSFLFPDMAGHCRVTATIIYEYCIKRLAFQSENIVEKYVVCLPIYSIFQWRPTAHASVLPRAVVFAVNQSIEAGVTVPRRHICTIIWPTRDELLYYLS